MDGIEVGRRIREIDEVTPVLFLTAKDGVEDTIKGLRTGANDYIKKPFSFEGLVERIKIHFRNRQHDDILRLDEIVVNLTTHQVQAHDKDVQLTSREFDLLTYFIHHKDRICSREDIIEDVWGIDFQYDTGVINVFMNESP